MSEADGIFIGVIVKDEEEEYTATFTTLASNALARGLVQEAWITVKLYYR
jgi:hypothetical protein